MLFDWKGTCMRAYVYLKIFLKWAVLSAVTGIICGFTGSVFYYCVKSAIAFREGHSWMLYLLPLSGVLIVWLYRICGMKDDTGTNMILSSIRSSQKVPLKMAPLIFVSTVLTHLCGGSSGREGAALQIGGSIGSFLGRTFKMDEKDIHIITMCGMSAVFSALFGTPMTAVLFSMEVVSVGIIYYVAFVPCMISSLIAYGIALWSGIRPATYVLAGIPALSVKSVFQMMVMGGLCALCGMLFCVLMHVGHELYQHYLKNPYIRILVGAGLVIVLTLLAGCYDYNSAGVEVIGRALKGYARPEAFLLKILFTVVTLQAGFKGGEIVPTFFIGSTFGNVVGRLIGLSPSFGAGVGLIAVFCAVVNCPIASMMLSIELFGAEALPLFGTACGVSYMLSGYYSLYSSQKIVYSKLHPTYVNAKTTYAKKK